MRTKVCYRFASVRSIFSSPWFLDDPAVTVLKDGHAVSRISDWIMYSVEAEYIEKVVAQFGPCEP